MAEHDRSAAPLFDVPVHLFLHLLALKLNVSTVEVLGIDPSDGLVVDVNVIQKQEVGGPHRPTQSFGLFFDHLRLSTQTNALFFEPVGEDVLKEIGFDLGPP